RPSNPAGHCGRARPLSWAHQDGFPGGIEAGESSAFLGKALQQWRRFPPLAMLTLKFEDAIVNLFQADRVRIPHWTTAIGRKAVTGKIDRIDVAGALRVSFIENTSALVNHDVHAALDDFFVAYRPPKDGRLLCRRFNKRFDHGIGNCFSVLIVAVPAGPGFLAQPAHVKKPFQY